MPTRYLLGATWTLRRMTQIGTLFVNVCFHLNHKLARQGLIDSGNLLLIELAGELL